MQPRNPAQYATDKILLCLSLLICLHSAATAQNTSVIISGKKLVSGGLLFMENKGQVADAKGRPRPGVLFTASSGGARIFLTADAIHYQFSKSEYPDGDKKKRQAELLKAVKTQTHHFSVELKNANPKPIVHKEQKGALTENYYLAHCPGGITGVHGYERIVYENVYPSIDWVIYSKDGFIEYDFLVHPGGDPSAIRMAVKNADKTNLNLKGELVIKTALGEVTEKAPVSYSAGMQVDSRFIQHSDGSYGFDVNAIAGQELRIDPQVKWATYYGGDGYESGNSVKADRFGYVYMAGTTGSTTSIADGGFQTNMNGIQDAFLVKFNSEGERLWATYYGGDSVEHGFGCAADNLGNVYLTGNTESLVGIASKGYQNSRGNMDDAFLVKFDSTGSRIWATYYGGNGGEIGLSCTVDNLNNVYIAGNTSSTLGIASGGFQNNYGGGTTDAFLAKFNSGGNLLWASYYGGSEPDEAPCCTTDIFGDIYLSGNTYSLSGISSGDFQDALAGETDCFLAKFSSTGNRVWARYYGGAGFDFASSCVVDGEGGDVYMSGTTGSTAGIASNGFKNNIGADADNEQYDAFLVKFAFNGQRIWGTYYGGNASESEGYGCFCAVDGLGNVYLSGYTSSSEGIAYKGFLNTFTGVGFQTFLVKFDGNCGRIWGSYFGGNSDDSNLGLSIDPSGDIYLTGMTRSASGLAFNAFQNIHGGGEYDAFLVRISSKAKYIFTGNGNWNTAANWLNNIMPPFYLQPGDEIIINPIEGGECILSEPVVISREIKLNVMPGANLRVLGNLIIYQHLL